jgi:beta-glucosidase
MIAHGYAKDSKQAAEICYQCGSDMDMESSVCRTFSNLIVKRRRKVKATIDDAAEEF